METQSLKSRRIRYQLQARLLIEGLPYMRRFRGQFVVIKYGGHAMKDEELKRSFALNVALLKYIGVKPVIVHGGGPQIGAMLERLDIESVFREGLRVTDDATMGVVEMVLVGKVNKEIVSQINAAGACAVGLSGRDGQLVKAKKLRMTVMNSQNVSEVVDLGNVGEVTEVNKALIEHLSQDDFIPVIAPTGIDDEGNVYNINADSVASAVAAALKAKRLLLLTDVQGLLTKEDELVRSLTTSETKDLLADGTIKGGMIPKVKCGLEALHAGVEKVMILDGRVENSILLELFTEAGIGTEIIMDDGSGRSDGQE